MLSEKRRRGAQPGNFNALKHGRRSVRKRAERRAASLEKFNAKLARASEWESKAPKIDYRAICDAIAASKRETPAANGSRAVLPQRRVLN